MNSSASSLSGHSQSGSMARLILGYGLMVVIAISLIAAILSWGDALQAGEAAVTKSTPHTAGHKLDAIYNVLLCLALILLLGRWLGKLCVYIGQPRVIGEMIAGIVLGPSVLGYIWPEAT